MHAKVLHSRIVLPDRDRFRSLRTVPVSSISGHVCLHAHEKGIEHKKKMYHAPRYEEPKNAGFLFFNQSIRFYPTIFEHGIP